MPAVQESRNSTNQPPGYTPPRRSESSVHGRVERRHPRRSSASVRVSQHQPRARIDQLPHHQEHARPRRRITGHELARRSSYRSRRVRPEITILSVSPMSEHPAFSDGHKGAYIPPEAPPSYEQAMRTTDDTVPTNDIARVFPERHIVNSNAVTIPSYSESVSQQLMPTVTYIASSSQLIISTNRTTFAPRRTRGIVSSQSDPSLIARSDIAERRDVRPTETHQNLSYGTPPVTSTTSTKPPKPPRPAHRPLLPPKPKERKSVNWNSNNNSNSEEDGRPTTTAENRQSSIVTQTMSSATNQNILSLIDSPNVGASPAQLQGPLLPNSSAPPSGSAMTNAGYSDLGGLFSADSSHSAPQAPSATPDPSNKFSNLEGLFSTVPQGGAQKTDFPNLGGNVAARDPNLVGSSQSNAFMMSQSQLVINGSNVFSSPAAEGSASNWGLGGPSSLLTPTSGTEMLQLSTPKPQPQARSLLTSNSDSMLTSQSTNGAIGMSQNFQPFAENAPNSNPLGGSSSQTILFNPQGGISESKQLILSPASAGLQALTPSSHLLQTEANESQIWGHRGPNPQPMQATVPPNLSAEPMKPELPASGRPQQNHQVIPTPRTGIKENSSLWTPSATGAQPDRTNPTSGLDIFGVDPVMKPARPELPSKGPPLPNERPVVIPPIHSNLSAASNPGMSQNTMLSPQVGAMQPSPAVLIPMQVPPWSAPAGGQTPRNSQQSRKLPPPPRPPSGPKRAPSTRPTTAPPPRPATKPNKPPAAASSLIEGATPPTKPDVILSSTPSILGQSSNSSLVQSPPKAGIDDLLGPSLLDDPLPTTSNVTPINDLLFPTNFGVAAANPQMSLEILGLSQNTQLTSTKVTDAASEPVYASLVKKNKVTSSQPFNGASLAPSSGTDSLMDLSKSEINTKDLGSLPPPLPTTRPPLEDFEDLLSPTEMSEAMAERSAMQNNMSGNTMDDLFGGLGLHEATEEDPYELVVEGLPHVKQTTAPAVFSGKKRNSGKLKEKGSPSASSKSNVSLLTDTPDFKDRPTSERRKSEDSEKSFGQKLRKKSLKFRMKFSSSKTDGGTSKSLAGESPTQPTANQDLLGLAPARPPPRPAFPKKAPARPTTAPAPPTLAQEQPSSKIKPAKPPPPKIAPMRSAPPCPNTNQNNRAAPTPKPRSNSKPNPPLKSSPIPKVRSVPVIRTAPPGQKITPSRAPPPKPPSKRYGNLRPPPAPKPTITKQAVSQPPPSVEVEDGRRPLTEPKVAVVAMFDFNGAAGDELIFKAGDTISDVTEVNPDWYRGMSAGKYGIFPKAFVSTNDEVASSSHQPNAEYPTTWGDDPDVDLPSFEDSFLEESTNEVTSAKDQIPDTGDTSDAPPRDEPVETLEEKDSESNGDVTVYDESKDAVSRAGIALFQFEGQDESELTFAEGDVIQITGEVDEDWFIGKVGDKEGMFPSAFVQIGEADPAAERREDTDIVTDSAIPTVLSPSSLSGFIEPMATGIQDYIATSSEEISFKVGDVLYLLEHVDETWLMVQHDATSAVGNVPVSHINIVHPLP